MKQVNVIRTGLKLFIICLGIVTLWSCHGWDSWHKDGVVGSGMVVEETRTVGFFDSIRVVGSCNVYITRGAQGLRLVGEDNILDIIDTHVENGTLVIDSDRSYSSHYELEAYVSMEAIKGFSISGAGKVVGDGSFTTDELELEIFGAGKIELAVTAGIISSRIEGAGCIVLEGSADEHIVRIAGAGKIEAEGLEVKTYNIHIAGAGSCRIFVTEVLEAVIDGAGVIYYRGNPHSVNSNIAGAGKIIKI